MIVLAKHCFRLWGLRPHNLTTTRSRQSVEVSFNSPKFKRLNVHYQNCVVEKARITIETINLTKYKSQNHIFIYLRPNYFLANQYCHGNSHSKTYSCLTLNNSYF